MARFDCDTVLAAVDLADVLTREVGAPRRRGSEMWWPSVDPSLAGTGRTPPTHIIPARGGGIGAAMFKDFASGLSGTAIDVVMISRGVDFATALETLAVEHGIDTDGPGHRPARPPPVNEPERRAPSPEMAAWVQECADRLATSRTRGAGRARAWLRARGLSDDVLAANLVGYDPGARHDPSRPRTSRQRDGIPKMAGVTFPHFDAAGCLAYVQTRNLSWTPDSDYPKYVNPTGLLNPRFGVWADPDPHHRAGVPVIIAEGPTDSLTAHQAGFDVVGLIGASHADDPATTAAILAAFSPDRPYLVLTDPDPAGRKAGHRLVVELWIGGAVALHRPPPGGGDLTDWAVAEGVRFPATLGAHVGRALAGASALTRAALAGDPSFITRAAGGPLAPAATEAWAGYLAARPTSLDGSGAGHRRARPLRHRPAVDRSVHHR